jgi:HSP20 family protein
MATQSEQRSLAVRPGESQPSQQNEPSRSGARTGLSRRREEVFGLSPFELLRANPFHLMRRMSEEMDRVFQEVGLNREGSDANRWSPVIEVTNRDGKYVVHAELAGLSPDDVRVEVADGALVIEGERKITHETNDKGVQRTEREYGRFYRSIPLPDGADLGHVTAKFQNGMLEVTIPIPEQKDERRPIPIEGQTQTQAGNATQTDNENQAAREKKAA